VIGLENFKPRVLKWRLEFLGLPISTQLETSRYATPLQNSDWFGLWVSKICHFEFCLGSGFSKIQVWVWVRVQVQGSKFFQKIGFWVQDWVGFCKKYQRNCLRKIIFLIYWNFPQKLKQNISKFLNSGSGSGTGFLKNQTRVRVLGFKIFQKTGFWVRVQNPVRVRLLLWKRDRIFTNCPKIFQKAAHNLKL
jgi:hypothetical protein